MADVFVSYARPDEPQATRVAEALRAIGYQVWRDDELPAHRAYAEVIEERLKSAQAVVVLWSADAAKSQWVRSEANVARSAGTLVQATLDGSLPPMPFDQIQCAGLSGWDGAQDSAGWRKLVASVAALAGSAEPRRSESKTHRSERTVCVLPFQNMSGDAEQEYFSDGISEDITTDLSKISALAVTARNIAFMFKGKAVDVIDVARKLDVGHVLEGSVRKAGNRLRITAQLIDGATGDHVWADRYDRDLTDIFAIQDEISHSIVDALKVKLLPAEKNAIEQRGTTNAEAYKFYLMARQYWVTGNHGDCRREERVIRICGRAIEIDPGYARAWALLAIAQSSLHFWFGQPGDDGVAASKKALALDRTIAEAHCPIARRFAEEQRFEDAGKEIANALRLDPDSWDVNREAGRLCLAQRRFAEARHHFERAVEAIDSDFYGWGLQMSCNFALDDTEAARRAGEITLGRADKALAQDPSNGSALAMSAATLLILGERSRADERIERAMLIDPDNWNVRYWCGCAYAMARDVEAAVGMLAPFFERASRAMIAYAEADPDLDHVRDDPRFKEMVHRASERVGTSQSIEAAAT
jgi:adenylate cyclase